jgi:hypothetical protein
VRLIPLDGSDRPLGERPTTQYIVHLIRSAEQFRRVEEMYK